MTQPPPPQPPIRPEFGVPPMRPMPPGGGLDDPVARKRRMVLGIIGAVVGVGIPVLIVIIGVVFSLTASGTGSERWIGLSLVVLAGLAIAGPIQIIAGIVLTAVEKTRPFGVGFLIGSAVGMIILAGACFAPFFGLQ
ncbi:MAG: hypothetical protein HOU81_27200 [Hamadaea sp.]|uniref:hypothetical protein n=1 Tax=Hamadaea sp. TaxID=2024425 RepID=UPI00183D4385|nr:hypothetical protein [Hamadaea sp.]NUR74513.1 hypothetical protein [Hamadaea sp.]NUT20983.1 hypothetical protein [Hamadaea sp.]